MQNFYMAIIEKTRGGYGVFFPDLPGCTSFGTTVSQAAKNAFIAAQAHAALTQEYGETLPGPRAPEEIPSDPDVAEQARLLIPVEIGDQLVRVNISLATSALAALDRAAQELSLTRSGAIAHLALAREVSTGRFVPSRARRSRNRSTKKK